MTLWLLDTNAVSDLVRNPRGQIRYGINRVGEANIVTSIVVACELRYGLARKSTAHLLEQAEAILFELDVQPLSQDADRHYARLRTDLEGKGSPIGQHDMLIAAHALALDATLVTANTGEFARIEGLKLANWLR